jgi:hypothetical protein
MTVLGTVSKGLVAACLIGLLSSCNSTDTKGLLGIGGDKAAAANPAAAPAPLAAQGAVVQGNCPIIVLRDGTEFHDGYAAGAKALPDGTKDQSKLIYRASIASTTRQCVISNDGMTITVQAAGRMVLGPAGGKGTVKLPVRVAVLDGDQVLYSELTQFETPLPTGAPASQFVFTKSDVKIPGGAADTAKIFIGFDEGPDTSKKKKKK